MRLSTRKNKDDSQQSKLLCLALYITSLNFLFFFFFPFFVPVRPFCNKKKKRGGIWQAMLFRGISDVSITLMLQNLPCALVSNTLTHSRWEIPLLQCKTSGKAARTRRLISENRPINKFSGSSTLFTDHIHAVSCEEECQRAVIRTHGQG